MFVRQINLSGGLFGLTIKKALFLFFFSLLLRALFFSSYIQHEFRFQQPDSADYHTCAVSIISGKGMFNPATGEPIFWRTPGYPAFLSLFYKLGTPWDFTSMAPCIKHALWFQILLCSFIPLLIWILVGLLTTSNYIAACVAILTAVHPGVVLASCYLLSDAIALIPWTLFLIFLILPHVRPPKDLFIFLIYAIFSGFFLGIYTWIRPNGQFSFLLGILCILIGTLNWTKKFTQIACVGLTFFIVISPWYVRNYCFTGRWFFCPMSGPILQTFVVPKIIRQQTGQDLVRIIQSNSIPIQKTWLAQRAQGRSELPLRYVPREFVCFDAALPVILNNPGSAFLEWSKEAIKTSFDLYSYQFVSLATKSHAWDPPEEFLSQKLAGCLYSTPLPEWMRVLSWLELLYTILLWIGIFGAIYLFIIPRYILHKFTFSRKKQIAWTCLLCILLSAGTIFMTGGFGYARLRLPVEALLATVSAIFWFWYLRWENFD